MMRSSSVRSVQCSPAREQSTIGTRIASDVTNSSVMVVFRKSFASMPGSTANSSGMTCVRPAV